jgi:YidC/Oxa1 family membrane protein insertase
MGKKETIGIVLITLVLFVWMYFNTPKTPVQPSQPKTSTEHAIDTAAARGALNAPPSAPVMRREETSGAVGDTAALRLYGKTFAPLASGTEKTVTIETDLYTAVLTTRGGMIRDWTLTNYKTWRGSPVELVNYKHDGDYNLLFQAMDGKLIDTRNLFFTAPVKNGEVIRLKKGQTFRLAFTLSLGDSSRIVREFAFTGGIYNFGSSVTFDHMDRYIANYEYQVTWEHGLNYTEENSVDESSFSTAYAYSGGESVNLEASKPGETVKQEITGNTNWVAQTTKYFTVAIVPKGKPADGAYLHGIENRLPDNGTQRDYYTSLVMRFEGQPAQTDSFMVYIGPLDYNILKSYKVGLEDIVGLGWKWVIRPIAEYVMLPSFEFLHSFIPNYGLVIILFSIILKLLLNPLTVSSMKSMRKMQALQPMMEEIKEKYKEDQQKMNQAIMNLYKEYKINPMGGCLPMFLQLPILYALWAIFRSNIALRQSDFIWWIKDLSIPDTILRLPFTLPLVGLNQLSGLATLMAVTQFIQMKMTTKDPRQMFMIYFMPVMMWLIFNNLPAGLNLYYFVFNLLSIGQQYFLNKKPMEEVLVKATPKKNKQQKPPRPVIGNRSMRRGS